MAGRRAGACSQDDRLRHPQPAGGHRPLRPHRGDDRASRPREGRGRGAAAVPARPELARGRRLARQALGTDSGGIAQGHGRAAVKVIAWRAAVLVGALVLWEVVARPLNPVLYIAPSRLPAALARMLSVRELPPLPEHVWLTTQEIVAAYALAVAAGLWLGFLLGLRRTVGRIYEPLLAALYAIPSVVWYPSLMLFFGLGPASKIAFGFLLAFFPIVLSVMAGIRQVPQHLVTVATSMGARPWTVFRKVMLPAMASTLVGGLRAGLALAVVGVLVGEILGARSGLGYVINYAYGLLMTGEYAVLVLIVAAGVLLIDGLAALAEARVRRWAG